MAERTFSIGEYSLTQRSGSGAWYRTHYDKARQQTVRVSLGKGSFEIAKTRLLEWYYANHKQRASFANPATVPLADVLLDYWNHHGCKLVSAKTTKILLRDWNDFWGAAMVGDVRDINRQEEFHEHLRKRGLSPNSINRVLEIGRAAIRRAWKRGVIDSAPFIQTVKGEYDKPLGRPLTLDELRRYYRGSDELHWQDFFLLMIGTGSRPKAVTTLEKRQLDFADGLINLNPEGRRQTNKFRPTVRLTPTLRKRFQNRPDGPLLVFHGKKVGRVSHLIRIARERAGLDKRVNAYSLRHTVARYLRQQGVDTAEIAAQLGHLRFGHSMTLRYMPHSPDYLAKSSAALEKLLKEVLAPVSIKKVRKAA